MRRIPGPLSDIDSIGLIDKERYVRFRVPSFENDENLRATVLAQGTYLCVAHGCHDTVGTSIESTLDHPLLGTGDSNNGADAFGSNGVVKLCLCQLL